MRYPPHNPNSEAAQAIKGARRKPPRPPLTTPGQLTRNERAALRKATHKGGTEATQTHATIRQRLLDAGWVTQPDKQLIATRAGRKALNAPITEPERNGITTTVMLKHRHGYTTRAHDAMNAGEVLDPASLDTYWQEQSDRRKHEASNARTEARKLADRAKRAA